MKFWLGAAVLLASVSGAQTRAPDTTEQRIAMVRDQIEERDVSDPRVLDAVRAVPRHLFVPENVRHMAYADHPLPIGYGQTISQPYIVALMTELLEPRPTQKVLEIGTGSGYQAAVLSRLVDQVYTIEIVAPLAERAEEVLEREGYDNVTVITGDGYRGYPDQAPFDGIIVTAAPEEVPQPLLDQLRVGGKLVIPVGDTRTYQELELITRTESGFETRTIIPVRFVPMTGEAEKKPPR